MTNPICAKLTLLLPIFLVFLTFPAFAEGDEHTDHQESTGLMRGQSLFYGLIKGSFESKACADCHNTVEIDTFNWNPSAMEIASAYRDRSLEEFTKAVMEPAGRTMSLMHQTFNLSESDVEMIKLFLDELEGQGLEKKKPVVNKIFLFILLGILLTWIVLDIFFIKKIRRRVIFLFLFALALGWQIKLMYEAGTALGRQQGYEPDQPVKFSHQVHAGDNQIDCKYCHTTVEYAKSAGIPDVNICWNCHSLVREGTYSGKHQIAKVVEAYEEARPIPWIRIHNLQDHAFFSHAQHVSVGKIDCGECHGPIEEMHRVRQVEDLSMGWCINCHRETGVQFFDNTFYTQYEELQKRVKSEKIDTITAEMIGGTECSKCHY